MAHYDFIGDIHGEGQKLEALLQTMGYTNEAGFYHHPERTAVFVGDFVDRGDYQFQALDIVRAMVVNGAALAVMGNHELNAIGHATKTQDGSRYLKTMSDGYRRQKGAFLNDVRVTDEVYLDYIEWFKTLPMWIETDDFCAVHACWQPDAIAFLTKAGVGPYLGDADALESVFAKGTEAYWAVETILKGAEFPIHHFGRDGAKGEFLDKEDEPRRHARLRWWVSGPFTYRNVADIPNLATSNLVLSDTEGPEQYRDVAFGHPTKPVFFGHYWRTEREVYPERNAVCVDFSAVLHKDNPLVAYQFTPGTPLSVDNFIDSAN